MSVEARIKDLDTNPSRKLSPMITKNIVEIVNGEFARQQTLFDAEAELKREEILNQYKKAVGYETLKKEHDKAKANVDKAQKLVQEAEKKLHLKGLDVDGSRHTCQRHYSYGSYVEYDNYEQRQLKLAEKKVDKLLEVVEQQGPENTRSKIIARLWLADTVGEAMVILREVLGNGYIPSLTKNDIKQITMEA